MRSYEKQTAYKLQAALLHELLDCSHGSAMEMITFSRRFHHEGMSFLTKTLPTFGKALDRALSGKVALDVPHTFFKKGRGTSLPLFLGSVTRVIFDDEGYLRDNVDYGVVRLLRTFLYFSYKIELPFDSEDLEVFCEKFVATDSKAGLNRPIDGFTSKLTNLAAGQLSELDNITMLNGSYGPGVSSNCKRTEKYSQFVPPSRLRATFGRAYFHLSNEFYEYELFVLFLFGFLHNYCGVDHSYDSSFYPSKVLFVPKDSRGPRVIACEDSRLMYAQKGIMASIYNYVERSGRFGGRVNFTDQTINQKLTSNKQFCTIDLKDASDLVSNDLVTSIFPPRLNELLQASRSPIALLPDGRRVELNKFAPMGSACCFPILALTVYTISCAAIYLEWGILPRHNKDVFVFGDDLITRNEYYPCVTRALQAVGLMINHDKSFADSRFTESCGRDDLDGHNVTPIRCKKLYTKPKRVKYNGRPALIDSGVFQHYISLANQLYEAGFKKPATHILDQLEVDFGKVPFGNDASPYPCITWYEKFDHLNKEKFDREKGNYSFYHVKSLNLKIRYRDQYSGVRRSLEVINGKEPSNISKVGARKTILQKDYVRVNPI